MTPDPLTIKSGGEIFAETLVGLVNALAWPMLIAFAILFFGKSLQNLISRVESASIAGNTVDFRKELKEVSKQIKEETAERQTDSEVEPNGNNEPTQDGTPTYDPLIMDSNEMNNLFSIANLSPASAVIEAFKYVEIEWSALIESKGISQQGAGRIFIKNRPNITGLPAELIQNMDRLRKLRNLAAHKIEHNITPLDAIEYVISAFQLANLLRAARAKSNAEASTPA